MNLLVAWLVFPLLLAAVSLGCGLLVERVAGTRLPGPLLLPVGFALLVVSSQAATHWDATAELATPLALVLAFAGYAAGRGRLVPVDWGWPAAAAAGVFAVFAAPVVFSGDATFAGYTVLGDTSIHFILVDRLMEHGHDLSGLGPSSYRAALAQYFEGAYPVGAHSALGALRPLVGQDVAWVFQPYLAFLAALTALVVYALLDGAIRSRPLRALVSFIAAQPALVLGYALQGGIKEVSTVLMIALLVALVPVALSDGGLRRLIPIALVSAAGIAVIGLAIAVWLVPILLATLGVILWRRRRPGWRLTAIEAGFFALVAAALSFPVLARAGDYIRTTEDVVTVQTEFGNLVRPLDWLQMFGIWPVGDYRLLPLDSDLEAGYVLIGVAIAAVCFGLAWAVRQRRALLLLYFAASAAGWIFVTRRGSPWTDAKALMIGSTPVMVAALLGAVGLLESRHRLEAALLFAALAFGVLWSNALAYHDVKLAPRDRLEELEQVAERVEGRGPTLYTEFEEFAKHFLRDGDPTGFSESWQPDGVPRGRFGLSSDIDHVRARYALRFQKLVLRRSPAASRPPSAFRREYSGRWYEVWTRRPDTRPLSHVALGARFQPGAEVACRGLRRLGQDARTLRARLAYVQQSPRIVLSPTRVFRPSNWMRDTTERTTVHAFGQGKLSFIARVPLSRRYQFWLEGSFGRITAVDVDGQRIGSVSYELNPRGQYAYLGTVELTRGIHHVTLLRGGGDPRPGNGGDRLLGPLVLRRDGEQEQVSVIDASQWRSLCGRRLDWVEVVRR